MAGLRNAERAVARLPLHARVGGVVAGVVKAACRQNSALRDEAIRAMRLGSELAGEPGLDPEILGPSEAELDELRKMSVAVLRAESIDEVDSGECQTQVRGHLLQALSHRVHDPGSQVCEWLWKGAPAGVEVMPETRDEDCGDGVMGHLPSYLLSMPAEPQVLFTEAWAKWDSYRPRAKSLPSVRED